jgi:hypothetical protein
MSRLHLLLNGKDKGAKCGHCMLTLGFIGTHFPANEL